MPETRERVGKELAAKLGHSIVNTAIDSEFEARQKRSMTNERQINVEKLVSDNTHRFGWNKIKQQLKVRS